MTAVVSAVDQISFRCDPTMSTRIRFDVLTLFPEIFSGYLEQSLLKLAIARGLVDVRLWDFRNWATDRHRSVDDKPFGGGPGMLLSCQPVFDAVEAVQADAEEGVIRNHCHRSGPHCETTPVAARLEPGCDRSKSVRFLFVEGLNHIGGGPGRHGDPDR